jgi:hypothetical protein
MGEGQFGAVAFSRTGDPATGDFRDAIVAKVWRRAGRFECAVTRWTSRPAVNLHWLG